MHCVTCLNYVLKLLLIPTVINNDYFQNQH